MLWYLATSGDLLQHFLTVIFNKLDKGETWDDDFELNTILQVQTLTSTSTTPFVSGYMWYNNPNSPILLKI